tara:strand:+ start:3561 stop:3791 length:231 start_codon:yes stop_codon:yes gene_type:complete
LEVSNVQVDIVTGTALSALSVPFVMSFVLSGGFVVQEAMINLMLLSLFIGLVGSVLSFLAWFHLRTRKWVLRFEYS